MKKINFLQKPLVLVLLVTFLIVISCTVYAITIESMDASNLILATYEREELELDSSVEMILSENVEIYESQINSDSLQLLDSFEKDFSTKKDAKLVYDSTLNREVTRVTLEDAEIDIDSSGELVSYKNFDDFSTVDKDKRDYVENQELAEVSYQINSSSDLNNTIQLIETQNDLEGYTLVDCSNNIEGAWVLTWCKDYGNNLINSYDCVNVVVDAKDGSIMLFGKNKMEPNDITPTITENRAVKAAQPIISDFDDVESVDVKLTFCRPNFYWEEGGPYEAADFVRLAWEVSVDDYAIIEVDAQTGEILGGGSKESISGRSMFVENFAGRQECAMLAYDALNRLGYDQTNYSPVYWNVYQSDINWILSRSDMYGLYLSCHGGITTDGTSSYLCADTPDGDEWRVSSNNNFGTWRFVYLDACLSSKTSDFANAFHATYSGECFVGWNVSVYTYTALDFNRRFFPRLGYMSVYDDVITSLWESRNAGYNTENTICDPGFMGDSNYYGWAW